MTAESLRARGTLFSALGAVFVSYMLVYGVVAAESLWSTREPSSPQWTWQGFRLSLALNIAGLLIAAIGVVLAGGGAAVKEWLVGRATPTQSGADLLSFSIPMLAHYFGLFLVALLVVEPSSRDATLDIPRFVSSVVRGPLEELLVVAAPIVVIRRLRPAWLRGSWTSPRLLLVVLVLAAARMFFHLYQGWSSLQHISWAIAAAAVYVAFGRVWALMLLHAIWNVIAALWAVDTSAAAEVSFGLLMIVTVGSAVALVVGLRRAKRGPRPVPR